jgi:hypothetical protein
VNYNKYAAVEILGGSLRGYGEFSAQAYKWPNDSGERGLGWEFVSSWKPDTDRNQLWLVLEKFMLSDSEFEDTRDWWYDCMKDPALALKAICESHRQGQGVQE